MRSRSSALVSGTLNAFCALALLLPLALAGAEAAGPDETGWQAVQSEVPVGKGTRIEVRLVGAETAGEVTVVESRLDMAPDGMATMVAALTPVPASVPSGLAFEADLVMAGRWVLTITASVAGMEGPVAGTVIFTAVERQAAPPAGAAPDGERKILYYRNPMGLPDVSPVPKDDWMGMAYIPVYEDEAHDRPGTVRISQEKVQRAGVRTEAATRRELTRTVRAVGTVAVDEARRAAVAAKFAGFIEELFVKVTGAEVRVGAPLMRVWIESPEILQKQADYLLAMRGGDPVEIGLAEANLRQFGITGAPIAELARSGRPVRSIVMSAPISGTVMGKPAVAGIRFEPGHVHYEIADLSTLWVLAEVAERDLPLIRVGQAARVTLLAGAEAPLEARVIFISPELNMTGRTGTVRLELPNPDRRLTVGLYAEVEIAAGDDARPAVAVPEAAVIDSGRRRVAFVARGEGVFEPRDLTLGRRGDGFVEVLDGLADGEQVVVGGNFLIDAESNLRAALAAFTAPAAQP